MNPDQNPQQPQPLTPTPDPTIAQPQNTPQPIAPVDYSQPVATPQPVAQPATFTAVEPQPQSPAAVPPSPTASPMFGSAIGSAPEGAPQPPFPSPKKPINKKLLIIIGAAVVVVIVGVVALLPLLTGKSNTGFGAITNVITGNTLSEFKGEGYTISIPKDFVSVDVPNNTSNLNAKRFARSGEEASATTSTVAVVLSPYPSTSERDKAVEQFKSFGTNETPDTDTSKDVEQKWVTVAGFEAMRVSGTALKDGAVISKNDTLYVFADKNFYLFTVNVAAADDGKIDSGAILDSIKINE